MTLDLEQEREWLSQCYDIATDSPDPSTQNGAFLITKSGMRIGQAYNAPTAGMELNDEDYERPAKYFFFEHSERSAILKAGKAGYPTKGMTMVAAWAACADCARAIVGAGITSLIRHAHPGSAHWNESIAAGDRILAAGGVDVLTVAGKIPGAPKVLFNGELWQP